MKFLYELTKNDTARITCIERPAEVIEFPEIIDGYKVTEIGSDVVPEGKSTVHKIIMPCSVRTLADEAILDMHYLKEMILNEGLEEIGDRGIYTCPDLLKLQIPASVKKLGEYSVGFMYEHGRSYRLQYFVMQCEDNSAAKSYADENEINYDII